MSTLATLSGATVFQERLSDGRPVDFWRCRFNIDVDGSPRAYAPGKLGEDYLANAGRPGNWWGIVTGSNGVPIIQGATDPAPGYYISTTSLQDPQYAIDNPLRYVDADEIPFIVLPGGRYRDWGARLGDYVYCRNTSNGYAAWAIFADAGPNDDLGEGSPKLAQMLGVNPDPKNGGTPDRIIQMFAIGGSGDGLPKTPAQIQAAGANLRPLLSALACLPSPSEPTAPATAA